MRVVAALAASLLASVAAHAEPFSIRDQNPLLAGFGLPSAMPSRMQPEGVTARADLFWGSTALIQERGSESLIVDAETREARFSVQGSFNNRLSWQLQLPYRYTGGGNLDGFIDSWHDLLGLSEGARPLLPDDEINIGYSRDGAQRLRVTSSAEGVGDIQAALGYQAIWTPSSALVAWLQVKLPTADADKLNGSGATDVSLLLAGERQLSGRWSAFGQAAVTWLGDGDVLTAQQRSVAWSGLAGLSWQAWRGLALTAQFDAHSAAFDSDLDFFSDALVLTVGGDYHFDSGWTLDIGVSEDVAVERSPDVVFIAGLKKHW